MLELIRVLEKTVPPSQADQNEAVKFIQEYISRDFVGFLRALSDVLYDQENPPVARAAAGLQLKNQLTARDEALRVQQQDRWRSLPEETRLYIKERVFRTLGTEVFRPSSAPQCVAYIALVELPERLWPGLIAALAENIKSPTSTPQLKLASLEAIGYICQDFNQSCLEAEDSNHILTALVAGMKDPVDETRMAATAALSNFCEREVHSISQAHPKITFAKLGESLRIEPEFAETILAQMIREDRVKGHLDNIGQVVHFDSKNVLQKFDEDILKLCSDVNEVVEKIRKVAPAEWWAANAHQT